MQVLLRAGIIDDVSRFPDKLSDESRLVVELWNTKASVRGTHTTRTCALRTAVHRGTGRAS